MQVLGAAGDELLHQREAEALGDAAVDLALHQRRVDGAADVVGGDDPAHLHGAEVEIDVDGGDLRGEAVGGVGHALALGVERRGRRIEGADGFEHDAVALVGELGEIDGRVAAAFGDDEARAVEGDASPRGRRW